MRTPHRLMAMIVAVAGLALRSISSTASAQTVNLSQCSSWSIVGGVFTCTPVNNGGGGNTSGVAPSGCAVNVSPGSGAPGSAVAVSVSCTSGTTPFTYSWSGGLMQNSTAQSGAGNPTANETYFVTVSNGSGSTTASGSYTVTTNGGNTGGGGNSGGGNACSQFGSTLTLNAAWPPSGQTIRYLSASVSGFGNNTVMVGQFTVPTNARLGFGRITVAEYGGAPTIRTTVLSDKPCDFGPQQSPYASSVGVTTTVNFSVGPNVWGYPALNPGQTYYLNVVNRQNGVDTCSAGDCAALMDLN